MNHSMNIKRTYIKSLEEELVVRTADSNMLEEIVDVMKGWRDDTSAPGSYTRQANISALFSIYGILSDRIRNTKQEGL